MLSKDVEEAARRSLDTIVKLRDFAGDEDRYFADQIHRVRPDRRASAHNLAHYLALRQHDVRELQNDLAFLGLSSLGRSESCVATTLDRVRQNLSSILGLSGEGVEPAFEDMDISIQTDARSGPRLLAEHTVELMGVSLDQRRRTRIMVTMPSEAAIQPSLIRDLLRAGMDIMRINTAHDDSGAWQAMIHHLKRSEPEVGRTCRVLVDLAGPKVRIGKMDPIRVKPGDVLTVGPGGTVPCSLPEALQEVQPDHRIWFDDGKVGGVVRKVKETDYGKRLTVEIVHAKEKGTRLKPEKGINLPDTDVKVTALTVEDESNLRTMLPYIDLIGLSFVRTPDDVDQLFATLDKAVQEGVALPDKRPGVVLKIETRLGFEHLPSILMTALQHPPVGVMVARGDLAVEVGYERLAEIQEEILWLCEAAHVPVIWATQVLEGMAKNGQPSRAEVSDAAMSGRAECVMLNKGPFIVDTVRFLSDVLERMAEHQDKKRSLLRRLNVSGDHRLSAKAAD